MMPFGICHDKDNFSAGPVREQPSHSRMPVKTQFDMFMKHVCEQINPVGNLRGLAPEHARHVGRPKQNEAAAEKRSC